MIKKCTSLKVSAKVLERVRRLLSSDEYPHGFSVGCFDNCREQGYVIQDIGFNVAFCENRNSNHIVVYAYTRTKGASNLPADDQWDDRRLFDNGHYDEAAEYVASRIREAVK